MTPATALRPRDTNLERCPECGVSVERDKIDLPHRCHASCPLTQAWEFEQQAALLKQKQEFEQVEATILSGQMPDTRVPGYLAEHPEFTEWYRRRVVERVESSQFLVGAELRGGRDGI